MKSLTPGVFSLVIAGFVYMQSFNVAVDMVKRMDGLMDTAAQQLAAAGMGTSNSPNNVTPQAL